MPYPFVKNYRPAPKPTEMTDIMSLNNCRNLRYVFCSTLK